MPVLLNSEVHFVCPNCPQSVVLPTLPSKPVMHHCPGLHFLAPFVQEGLDCKVEANEREDYVGQEMVRTDDQGRPIMSVVTTRNDGQDCVVFAPTAKAGVVY